MDLYKHMQLSSYYYYATVFLNIDNTKKHLLSTKSAYSNNFLRIMTLKM